MGYTCSKGFLPPAMVAHDTWVPFWANLIKEVNEKTGDQEGVSAMLQLSTDLALMMALHPLASLQEQDTAWLIAAHRVLYRLDRACYYADLAYLAIADAQEKQQAELRVTTLQHLSARVARSSNDWGDGRSRFSGGGGGFGGPGFNGAKRFKVDKPASIWCPAHKRLVNHRPDQCRLAASQPAEKTGK